MAKSKSGQTSAGEQQSPPNYGLLVRYTMRAFTQVLQGVASAHDITAAQFRVLRTIGDASAITQVELANLAAMDRPYAASIVKQLHGKGFIKRIPNKSDGRRIDLLLTARGKKLLDDISRQLDHANERAVSGVKQTDLAVFCDVIEKIRHNLESHYGADQQGL